MARRESHYTAEFEKLRAELVERLDRIELRFESVDRALVEMVRQVERSDRREIRNRLAVLCEHLLKWQFVPPARGGGWYSSVRAARRQITDLIEENPALAPYPATWLAWAYARGREKAEDETGLVGLPEACPWTIERVLDREFWPIEAPADEGR